MSSSSKKETNYKELFGDMTYAELVKWSKDHDKDWDRDVPKWSSPFETALTQKAEKEFPEMNLLELILIWEKITEWHYGIVGDLCHKQMMRQEPIISVRDSIDELKQSIDQIQKSVEVLLKEEETNQVPIEKRANITPAQLSRLKGGL